MDGQKDCIKCGALLPDDDEGICPACGTPFGRATMAMKIDPSELAAIAAKKRASTEVPAGPVPTPQASSFAPPSPSAKSGPPIALIAAGVAVVIILVVVLILVT